MTRQFLVVAATVAMISLLSCEVKPVQKVPELKPIENDSSSELIVKTVMSNNGQKIKYLALAGANVNAKDARGVSPLLLAIMNSKLKAFVALLEVGADPNQPDVALAEYAKLGRVSVMLLAARHGNPDFLRRALEHGGDPNFPVGIDHRTPIFAALYGDRNEHVRILIKHKANLNHLGPNRTTPLTKAASIGKFDLVYEMLMEGADPTINDQWGYGLPELIRRFADGGVVIGSASDRGYLKTVEELTRRGLLP
jgi:ankyrin repeat protein